MPLEKDSITAEGWLGAALEYEAQAALEVPGSHQQTYLKKNAEFFLQGAALFETLGREPTEDEIKAAVA